MHQSIQIQNRVLGSHSALEIMDGAKDEDFETMVFCQKGREVPYQRFNRIADEIKIIKKFKDMASPANQKMMREKIPSSFHIVR